MKQLAIRSNVERGALALEAAIIIPILVIMAIGLISLTYITLQTDSMARSISDEAARAASQQQSQAGAYSAADNVLKNGNISSGILCDDLNLSADLSPGGLVTATVTCQGKSVLLPGFPAQTITKTHTSNEIVDLYRSGS